MDWSFLQPLREIWPQKLPGFLDKIDWQAYFHNPYFIGSGVIILAFALYKRMYKFLALVLCSGFFYLAWCQAKGQNADTVTPENIVTFVALSLVIIAIGIYFFFIRSE